MIVTKIDDSEIQTFLGAIDGMTKTVKTAEFSNAVIKRVHAALSQEFDETADAVAMSSPANFHHVYEWGLIGVPQARLWKHTLSGHGGNRVGSFTFKASKKPIPTPQQRASNPNDPISQLDDDDLNRLSDRRYVFHWKAPVMEYNMTVTIVGKYSPKKLLFIPTWETQTIKGEEKPFLFTPSATMSVPGGEQTTGRFTGLWASWWQTQAPTSFERHLSDRIGKDVADSVRKTVRSRTKSISLKTGMASFREGRLAAEAHLRKTARNYESDNYGDDE